MKPDSVRTTSPYPLLRLDTLYFSALTPAEVVEALEYADEHSDQLLEDLQNEDPENESLTSWCYGYVWPEGAPEGTKPVAFGTTLDGYDRFRGLPEGLYYVEVEVRGYDAEA